MSTTTRFSSPKRSRHMTLFSMAPPPRPELKLRDEGDVLPPPKIERSRIWQLNANYHCSIVGTCLTSADVRQMLAKLDVPRAANLTEHEVHACGVRLASQHDFGGKVLNKALERKHRAHIVRFGHAATSEAVLELWSASLKEGDIPGAYWAAMTHASTTSDVRRKLFEDVHMLSHLVGAANRADIRRLRELERENAELAEKIQRQERRLHEAVSVRDDAISRLQRLIADTDSKEENQPALAEPAGKPQESDALLLERLARSSRRSERLEARAAQLQADLEEERRARTSAEARIAELDSEVAALEASGFSDALTDGPQGAASLDGSTILYVGGRKHNIARLRAATEAMGGNFLHHDGGDECSGRLISPMVGRADLVVFPVDCVSHDAVGLIKRTCRQLGRRYVPLRSSGLASFLAALGRKAAEEAIGA